MWPVSRPPVHWQAHLPGRAQTHAVVRSNWSALYPQMAPLVPAGATRNCKSLVSFCFPIISLPDSAQLCAHPGDSMADNVTITLTQLAASLAEEHQLTKRAGRELLDNLVSLITKHLKKGERIRIAGLGILQVRKRPARMGRNPATGEAIKIGPSKKVAFRASKELKEAI